MKDEAIKELRNRTDIAIRMEKWLQEAYLEVAYGYRFYELEKSKTFILSVAAEEITFTTIGATDIKHTLSLKDTTNNRKLIPASFRFLDRRFISNGVPTHYCRFGAAYLFDAKPSSTGISYKLRYRKQITEPNFSDNSSPETPREWDEVIRLFAIIRGFNALFEPEQAASKRTIALDLVSRLPTDEFVEAEDQEFGIEVRQ